PSDHCIDADREGHEEHAYRVGAHPELLQDRHQDDEDEKAAGVEAVDAPDIVYETSLHESHDGSSRSLFVEAGFPVDRVLTPVLDHAQENEGDERALRDHVVAEREAQERQVVERTDDQRNEEREERPQHQDDDRQVPGLLPVAVSRVGVIGHDVLLPQMRLRPKSLPSAIADKANRNHNGALGVLSNSIGKWN